MVEYLKQKQNLTYHKIALLLNRDEGNIRTVYSKVKRKGKINGLGSGCSGMVGCMFIQDRSRDTVIKEIKEIKEYHDASKKRL